MWLARREVSDSHSLGPLSQAAQSWGGPVQLPESCREVSAREVLGRRTRGPGGREGRGGGRPGDIQRPDVQPQAPGAPAPGCAQVAAALRWVCRGGNGVWAPRRRRGAVGGLGGSEGRAAVPAAAGWGSCARLSPRPGRRPGSWVAAPLARPGSAARSQACLERARAPSPPERPAGEAPGAAQSRGLGRQPQAAPARPRGGVPGRWARPGNPILGPPPTRPPGRPPARLRRRRRRRIPALGRR